MNWVLGVNDTHFKSYWPKKVFDGSFVTDTDSWKRLV